jgi:LPS export ABC transporter protein LptC
MKNKRTLPEARTLLPENKCRGSASIRFYLIFSALGVIITLLIITPKLRKNILSDISIKNQVFTPARAGEAPSLEIHDFRLIQTAGEKKQWELEAKSALEYEEGVEVQIADTSIKFFKDNKVVLTMKANTGIVDLRTNNVKMAGNIDAVSRDGMELKTDSLQWFAKDEKLVTDDPVLLRKEGMRIRGEGLVADVSLGKIEVKKSARVEVPRE